MITVAVSFTPPGAPTQSLGSFSGTNLDEVRLVVRERWPLLPESMIEYCVTDRARGFKNPETIAKAVAKIRDPDFQRRRVATRLANEAARRAREEAMPPEERDRLRQKRAKKYNERWRRYYLEKGAHHDS